jgi:UDP-3-O-acyl-N-acetylglucosamine deacetylase
MLLDSQNANNYINKLEKTFKFYVELKKFAKATLLQGFSIDETYFTLQIKDLSIEERLKYTYEMAKGKILSFEYKKKPK